MSTQREEAALRRSLEERRPLAIPPELSARLDRIPLEVKQRPSAPKRVALAVAPWAALLAAGLILAFGPLAVTGPAADPVTAPGQPWDPLGAVPSYTDIGIFGLPWVPALLLLGLAGLTWTAWRLATRRPLRPGRPHPERWLSGSDWVAVLAIGAPFLLFGLMFLATRDDDSPPQVRMEGYQPGPLVSEVRQDGGISAWDLGIGDWGGPPSSLRYVYRVGPGTVFTHLVNVRNDGPFPVRFLGIGGRRIALEPTDVREVPWVFVGFGLPRDAAHPSGRLEDAIPFRPVELPAGGEVTLVAAYVAGTCADPAGPLESRVDDNFGMGYEGVIETLGWRQEVELAWGVDITVTAAPGSTCTDRSF